MSSDGGAGGEEAMRKEEEAIALWKMKKLIKSLEAARG